MSSRDLAIKALKLVCIGFVSGMAIGNIIAIASSYADGGEILIFSDMLLAKTGSAASALTVQTLMSGVLGAVAMGGVILYELERPGLLIVSLSHYSLIMLTYFPIALSLGWIEPSARAILTMAAIQAVVYIFIWMFMYLRYQAEVREMNELLERCETA